MRVLQAFTNEKLARGRFGAAVERAYNAAIASTRARAILTAIAIFLVFGSVVVVLWVGAQDVLSDRITPGRLSQFVLYAVFAAAGLGQLSETWGELSQASGAAERLFEILGRAADDRRRRRIRWPCRSRRAARWRSPMCASPIRAVRRPRCSTAYRSRSGAARRSRSSGRRAPARARSST